MLKLDMCTRFWMIFLLLAYHAPALPYNNNHEVLSRNSKEELLLALDCPSDWTCVAVSRCQGADTRLMSQREHCGKDDTQGLVCCRLKASSNGRMLDDSHRNDPAHASHPYNSTIFRKGHIYNPNNPTHNSTSSPYILQTISARKSTKSSRSTQNVRVSSPSVKACEKYSLQFLKIHKRDTYRRQIERHAIIRGESARKNEFPYIVAIGYVSTRNNSSSKLVWGCGGTIISERFVLTAAHCITDAQEAKMRPEVIRAGVKRLATNARAEGDYGVADVRRHPQHRADQRHHDLALLRMDRPIVLSNTVQPACLPPPPAGAATNATPALGSQEQPGSRLVAAGWGATNPDGTGESADLKKAEFQVLSTEECKNLTTVNGKVIEGLDNKVLCAVDPTRNADTCTGDSGGPLVARKPQGLDILVAVTSFGSFPCGGRTPGVYARTLAELPWIESVVWP